MTTERFSLDNENANHVNLDTMPEANKISTWLCIQLWFYLILDWIVDLLLCLVLVDLYELRGTY